MCGWVIYSMCNVDCDCTPMFIRQTVVTAQFFCFVFVCFLSAPDLLLKVVFRDLVIFFIQLYWSCVSDLVYHRIR